MSIHIKEYFSLLIIIGIIKTFSGNKKINDVIKLISFFSMLTMIVFPLMTSYINGELFQGIGIHQSIQSDETDKYSKYFAQKINESAISKELKNIEDGFRCELSLRNIRVTECRAEFDGILSVNIVADKVLDATVIDRLKSKYLVEKVNIRLVNTYD